MAGIPLVKSDTDFYMLHRDTKLVNLLLYLQSLSLVGSPSTLGHSSLYNLVEIQLKVWELLADQSLRTHTT